ncbi:hypothetical protein HKCCE3408_15600 [Rhodobacterales bacterium HKCCE3408]|nr:hypothetical protein [Rhodobacterales bacterium HKCCE3408]
MKRFFTILTVLFGVLFAGAVAIVLMPTDDAPGVTRVDIDSDSIWTPEAASFSPGTFTSTDRPDLVIPPPAVYDYTEPNIPGVGRHRAVSGFRGETWLSYAPAETGEPQPLIVLFPGASRPAMSMIDMWRETATREGLVLIAFDGLRNSGLAEDPRAEIIHQALAGVQEIHPVDMDRVFLFGHSAGAIEAQVVLNRVAGPWRAAAVHSGPAIVSWMHPVENPLPVRNYIGSSDSTFSVWDSREGGELMARGGHDYDLQVIPGHTHWFYEIGPLIADDAWSWFETFGAVDELAAAD